MTNYSFQAATESRRRQREWEEHRWMLVHPPAGSLTYLQAERRRDLAERWDWLRYPDDVRRRAVEASRQGGEAMRQIEERQRRAREAARHRENEIREIQERLESLKSHQIFKKARLTGELQGAEKALAETQVKLKALAVAEKKLLHSCPFEVVERYQHSQEEVREKAVANLLRREAEEAEAERRREEAEAASRRERQVMRPAPEPKKTGGWTPPRPT